MKYGPWILFLIIMGLAMINNPQSTQARSSRLDSLWIQAEKAEKEGLPATAEKYYLQIYPIELSNQKWPEALRALTRMITNRSVIEGNRSEIKINLLEERIKQAPTQFRPMLQTILAEWYQQFYRQNRWRFLNRTQTEEIVDSNLLSWDLPRILGHIDQIYRQILSDAKELQKIPIQEYNGFLEKGDIPDTYRPTLYDFVAFKAIEFYTLAEHETIRTEEPFELDADSDALSPVSEFIRYRPETPDSLSSHYKAFRLLQDLISFHASDPSAPVFLDADLQRLQLMKNLCRGENKQERYLQRLEEIAIRYPQSELSSLARYYWARELINRGDYYQADRIARIGAQTHPQSRGGINCRELQKEIRLKSFEITSEKILPPQHPFSLSIQYRNIDTLHLRLYPVTCRELLAQDGNAGLEWIPEENLKKILQRPPILSQVIPLTPGDSFLTQHQVHPLAGLNPGIYRIMISHQSGFTINHNQIESILIQVSNLSLIQQYGAERHQGYIVHNRDGYPLPGIPIRYMKYDHSGQRFIPVDSLITDSLGFFCLGSKSDHFSGILIAGDPDRDGLIQNNVYHYPHYPSAHSKVRKILFYTDRSIYRPGQLIHFKGICVEIDPDRQSYQVIPFLPVTLRWLDVNRQEIGQMELTSNDYGSVAGVWTAPTTGLNGTMSLVCQSPEGETAIQVEEYKRPSFEIRINPPQTACRLNDTITIEGKAETYSGAPLDQASVIFRITRQTNFPFFHGDVYLPRRLPYPGKSIQEIGHGSIRTDSTGRFQIRFVARPDKQIDPASLPVFTYQVQADITDATGETHSDQIQVRVGYRGMELDLKSNQWLTDDQEIPLRLECRNLSDKPLSVTGTIQIYRLIQPVNPIPAELKSGYSPYPYPYSTQSESGSLSDWNNWKNAERIKTIPFETNLEKGYWEGRLRLPAGIYRAIAVTFDDRHQEIKSELILPIIQPHRKRFPISIPFYTALEHESYHPGQTIRAIWGTGYQRGPALVEIMRNNRLIRREWLPPEETQSLLEIPVSEDWRGGITLIITQVKDNRCYHSIRSITVPWENKELQVRWKRFRSTLQPGSDENWEIEIRGPNARQKTAELVATLYDQSLDQFIPHRFPHLFQLFPSDVTRITPQFSNQRQSFITYQDHFNPEIEYRQGQYRDFPSDIRIALSGYGYLKRKSLGGSQSAKAEESADLALNTEAAVPTPAANVTVMTDQAASVPNSAGSPPSPSSETPKPIPLRKNLQETAFFFPQIEIDTSGIARIRFQVPEALTRWKFIGLAHTVDLESGILEDQVITQKEIMIQPLIPRFLRYGDSIRITAKLSNLTDHNLLTTASMSFFHPENDRSANHELGLSDSGRTITIPPHQSRTLGWDIRIPIGIGWIGYRIGGTSGDYSDGEEGVIPMLSNRIAVRESIPLWMSQPGQKQFQFTKLLESGRDSSLIHRRLTAQIAVNPSWYAILALPYLMEYPYECAEQVFNRIFANALGDRIVSGDPRIAAMIEQWKRNETPSSALDQNPSLKSIRLEETPWIRQSKQETQSHQQLALYLDPSYLRYQQEKNLLKLARIQLENGAFPWFPGGIGNVGITLYILSGMSRLRQMGCQLPIESIEQKTIQYLDQWITEQYRSDRKNRKTQDHWLTPYIAIYLYGRSFYLDRIPLDRSTREAVNTYRTQAEKHWLKLDSRMSQAQLALALYQWGRIPQAKAILRSLHERSILDEELGRYWREQEYSWWWYRAPIETQALMIEAFSRINRDTLTVDQCRIWLLKQKQTQDWKTTKATADAVYSLLLKGSDWLTTDTTIRLQLGSVEIKPDRLQPGIPFLEHSFNPDSITPDLGQILIGKSNPGIIWGGIHWEYLQEMDRITPHAQNPLKLKKTLTLETYSGRGPVLSPLPQILKPGDKIMVRIELQTDRDMEYIHLKDYRGSGTEPINVISHYQYRDGLRYYESTRDAATHFFIDYLPKGTYIFEYPIRITQTGIYTNGIATVECMYAPEFNAHSGSQRLEVNP